ncbi:Zn(II)2Cys6 transcription factor [Penicillium sp. IBT 18751x]|nr:Zn(II)2Cys6 transcription factor [Penicillium sp. IBT 18751x]
MARPGQRPTLDNDVRVAIQRCLESSHETVELISQFWAREPRTMMACWYGLYFLSQAVLIPVICLRNDPQQSRAIAWVGQIQEAMRILESMAILNPNALRCLSVLKTQCGTYLNQSIDCGALPTDESPQMQLVQLYPLMWPLLDMAQLSETDSVLQESTIVDFLNQLPGV